MHLCPAESGQRSYREALMTANEIRQTRDKQGVIRDQQIYYYQMWALMEIAALLVEIRDDMREGAAKNSAKKSK
jgi:hypothetical protein